MENKVLAVVNGREITDYDVQGLLQGLGPNAMQFQSEEGQKALLEQMIAQELLYADAVDAGMDNDEEFIKAVEDMKVKVLQQHATQKLLASITIADEEAEAFYGEHKEMFVEQPMVQASHILVDSEEKAAEIAGKAKEGADFAELAQENSSCPSSAQGGDLGEFAKGQMVPEFEDAAFNMEIGEVSAPVQTQFGFHVIKLTGKKEGRELPFAEVKEQINGQLMAMKQNQVYTDKIEELKGKYDVKING